MTEAELFSSAGSIGLALAAIVIAALWIALPFAVFGIKSRLDYQSRLLASIRDAVQTRDAGDSER